MKIERYQAYKDSEVEWLGDVPEHWKIKRLKDLTKILTCGFASTPEYVSEEVGVPFLSAQNVRPNRLYLSKYSYISKELHKQLTKYRKPQRNDVLVTRVGAGIGDACIVNTDFEFSIYVSLTHIRTNNELLPSFIVYFFGTAYLSILNKAGTPDGGGQGNLNVKNVNRFLIATPPLCEQKAIARYLNTKAAQIDRKIDLLTQKAAQYSNLKQSLINETVTRGLDKSVPMKDSGVEWLGKVPKHWEVRRVKEFAMIVNGSTPKSSVPENWDGNYAWVTTDDLGKVKTKFITDSKRTITEIGFKSCGTTLCPEGSIVLSSRAPIGHIGVLSIQACTNQGCKTLVVNQRVINTIFIFYSILSSKEKLQALGRGTTFIELSTKELSLFNLPLPSLPEQKAFANYLDTKTAQIDQIIQTINTQIEKLKELRKTLINDVVTGKIKVV